MNQDEHATEMEGYYGKLTRKTGTMRGLVFVLMAVFLACKMFEGYFGAKLLRERGFSTTDPENSPDDQDYSGNHNNDDELDSDSSYTNAGRGVMARVRPLIEDDPNTVTVRTPTVTVMEGAGFPCTCSYCGTDYFAQRKPREGNNTYCSTECHDGYWREQRRVSE